MKTPPKLKPCPFCGNTPNLIRTNEVHHFYGQAVHIICINCFIRTYEIEVTTNHQESKFRAPTLEQAIDRIAKLWNSRKP